MIREHPGSFLGPVDTSGRRHFTPQAEALYERAVTPEGEPSREHPEARVCVVCSRACIPAIARVDHGVTQVDCGSRAATCAIAAGGSERYVLARQRTLTGHGGAVVAELLVGGK